MKRRREKQAAERLQQALELYALGEALLRQRIRREKPGVRDEDVEAEVSRWRQTRPGAERGDAAGRSIRWPPPRRATRSSRR
ncbi:MAG: hypothetical protein HYZ28_06090 [Myxococcales bacterium]|nr:hypothetical protein [Myxococcales bacterium]